MDAFDRLTATLLRVKLGNVSDEVFNSFMDDYLAYRERCEAERAMVRRHVDAVISSVFQEWFMEKKCERCGGVGEMIKSGPFAGTPHSLDYCAVCSKDLCEKCMAKGCCGNVPAKSGNAADNGDDGDGDD